MRVLILPIALAITTMSAVAPVFAQEQTPVTDMGLKFELKPHENGFVRLNKETGEVSFCRVLTGSLICRLGVEEREAYEEMMAAVETRLELAEERLEALESITEKRVPSQEVGPEPPVTTDPEKKSEHDLDEEFDEAMEIAKSAMRRFFEAVQDLRSEFENR